MENTTNKTVKTVLDSTDLLLQDIVQLLLDKKAYDVVSIKVTDLTIVADYFVIASGHSSTQVKALAGYVDEKLSKDKGIEPLRIEGVSEGRWIVIDYGAVIVEIFHHESRQYYQLERLWEDGKNTTKYS